MVGIHPADSKLSPLLARTEQQQSSSPLVLNESPPSKTDALQLTGGNFTAQTSQRYLFPSLSRLSLRKSVIPSH